MNKKLELIRRATRIYFSKGNLLFLEATIQKWLNKKDLPYRVNGAEFTPWSATIKLISKDLNYPETQFNLKLS